MKIPEILPIQMIPDQEQSMIDFKNQDTTLILQFHRSKKPAHLLIILHPSGIYQVFSSRLLSVGDTIAPGMDWTAITRFFWFRRQWQ